MNSTKLSSNDNPMGLDSKNSTMALNLGEAFVDAVVSQGSTRLQKRWFLPGLQGPRALADWMTSEQLLPLQNVFLCTSWANNIFRRQLGGPAYLVVTSGFEGWLELASTSRPLLRTKADHILGIHERTASDGKILTAVTEEDLVFLAEKLKLMKAQTVALTFLHSSKNPANEVQAATFLRDRGFRVFASHEMEMPISTNEIERWNETLNRVYTEEPFRAWLEPWLKVFTDTGMSIDHIRVMGRNGLVPSSELKDACGTSRGAMVALEKFARVQKWSKPFTYFGFHQFIDQKQGLLDLQPLQILERGDFGLVNLSQRTVQYEIGPMFWGRGQQATVLDTIVADCHPPLPPEFMQRWNDRGAKRFHETLLALSRSTLTEQRLTYDALLELVAGECRENLQGLTDRFLIGPLAGVFQKWMPKSSQLLPNVDGFEITQSLILDLQ